MQEMYKEVGLEGVSACSDATKFLVSQMPWPLSARDFLWQEHNVTLFPRSQHTTMASDSSIARRDERHLCHLQLDVKQLALMQLQSCQAFTAVDDLRVEESHGMSRVGGALVVASTSCLRARLHLSVFVVSWPCALKFCAPCHCNNSIDNSVACLLLCR